MKRLLIVPAVAIFGLSAAPLIPITQATEPLPTPHQVMAALPMPEPAPQTVVIVTEKVEPTPEPTPVPITRSAPPSGSIAASLRAKTAARFGAGQVENMMDLVGRESGLNPYAVNKTSGACGIPQALPCSKLLAVIGSLDNIEGQLDWLINYVANRYGTPSNAIAFHNAKGWY